MPVVDVGVDESLGVEGEFAPAADGDWGFPGEGGIPTEGPIAADGVSRLLKLVQFHLAIEKPGLNESDHLLVAIAPSKGSHGVFEIHILGIDLVGGILGKSLIVFAQNLKNVHF